MEDSGQRKRRLEEMRKQAEESEASGGGIEASASATHYPLSNPLAEPSLAVSTQHKSYSAPPRFDFYTDPMAAFSSNKKSNVHTPPCMPPPLYPESMNSPMTHSFSQGSPGVPNTNPTWNGPRGSPQYHFPPQYQSSGFEMPGRPFYNSGQHMTHQYQPTHNPNFSTGYSRSPGFGSGRGRGGHYSPRNNAPGWGGGGQRPSYRGRYSGEYKPQDVGQFYKKSMVEDPWQLLEPIMWKTMYASSKKAYPPESSNSWASKSSNTNKGGPSTTSVNSSSQPSLAEYLAAAFNEAADSTEKV